MPGEMREVGGYDVEERRCGPVMGWGKVVEVPELEPEGTYTAKSFWSWPMGPLLFKNESSDARDHCANERTFLSYLRLSVYMAIVSNAIILSFHLKTKPNELERKIARPLGIIFWALSLCCLGVGVGNYITTVKKYSRRVAIVQTGWKTQIVLGVVAVCIVGTCIVLLVIAKISGEKVV